MRIRYAITVLAADLFLSQAKSSMHNFQLHPAVQLEPVRLHQICTSAII